MQVIDVYIVDSAEIGRFAEVLYFGWSKREVEHFVSSYQKPFFGTTNDFCLAIMDVVANIKYLLFRGSNVVFSRPKQFLLDCEAGVLLVYLDGFLYRIDLSSFKETSGVEFDLLALNKRANIQSYYPKACVIPKKKFMVILDHAGVSIINSSGVIKQFKSPDPCCDDITFSQIDAEFLIIETCSLQGKYRLDFQSLTLALS